MVYLNKRTGEVRQTKPLPVIDAQAEVSSFRDITLPDGTMATTFLDGEGARFYVNWDDQVCLAFFIL